MNLCCLLAPTWMLEAAAEESGVNERALRKVPIKESRLFSCWAILQLCFNQEGVLSRQSTGLETGSKGVLALPLMYDFKTHLHALPQCPSLKPEEHTGALQGSGSLMAFRGDPYEILLVKSKIRSNLSDNFLFFPSPTRDWWFLPLSPYFLLPSTKKGNCSFQA